MGVGFEPTRAEHNGLAVHRLNHSAIPPHTDPHLNKSIKIVNHLLMMHKLKYLYQQSSFILPFYGIRQTQKARETISGRYAWTQ